MFTLWAFLNPITLENGETFLKHGKASQAGKIFLSRKKFLKHENVSQPWRRFRTIEQLSNKNFHKREDHTKHR